MTRRQLTALLASAALTGCAGLTTGDEPRFDVCRSQIVAFVREAFDQEVTEVTFYYVYERRDLRRWDFSKAVVQVAECPGYHYFEIYATADTCEMLPHYGRQPDYLGYRGAFDGC